MKYCLDANVFIEPSKMVCLRYRSLVLGGLVRWNQDGIVCSVLPVYDEIVNHREDDALVRWVKQHRHGFFLSPDEETWVTFRDLADLVNNVYENHLAESFLGCADLL